MLEPGRGDDLQNPAWLVAALKELYGWYERGEYMLEKTTRDVDVVPALRPAMDAFRAWHHGAAGALLAGQPQSRAARRRTRAAIGHALAFETWRSLVRTEGLTTRQAVELMSALVAAAAAPAR